MEDAYDNRPWYLQARRDGKVVGVLQLVEQRSVLFGSHLTSLPYFDAAGVLADDESIAEAILAEAQRVMLQTGSSWVELRHTSKLSDELPARTDKVTLHLPLPAGADALWQQLKPKVRNQIRKAQRNDLAIDIGGGELIDRFHTLYCRKMRDLGSPSHSRRFFELLVDTFDAECRIFVVRRGDRYMAAGLSLTDRDTMHVPWAASDKRYDELCPNMLLYWSMLEHACAEGVGTFNFGRCTRDSGTYRFKTQWGGTEVPLHWHYLLENDADLPGVRHDSPKYRMMVACWKRMPVCVTRRLGPGLIAKLS